MPRYGRSRRGGSGRRSGAWGRTIACMRASRSVRFVLGALVLSGVVCGVVDEPSARADTQKFALAMMHFNVQYVAGGMVGFWPKPDPRLDKNAEEIEDQIIVESFEPVLDLFLAHPTWATD